MKLVLSIALLAISSQAAYASTKICFGSTRDEETRGVVISAKISARSVTLKTVRGDAETQGYNGTFPTYGTKVNGRDGKVYREYKGHNSDYQDVIMIDEALLKANSTGLLQIRARGEGFFNSVYVCKDSRD